MLLDRLLDLLEQKDLMLPEDRAYTQNLLLDALHLGKVIVGKAIYENHITLEDIKLWSQSASSPASM